DAGELWAASHVCATATGTARYIGVPVFPSRNFRHGFVFVHRDSDITRPEQLAGRRIGVVEYVQTAAVWIRGFLQHDFGVDPANVQWVTTQERTHARVDPPAGLDITVAPDARPIEQLLFDRDVDAIIGAFDHHRVLNGPGRRLFTEPRVHELDYYRRTGAYPIMHMVGIRRDVYDARPSIAADVMALYDRAKTLGQQRLRRTSALSVSLPWLEEHLAETAAAFGGDPFAYGLRANLTTLRLLTRYVFEQGLTERLVAPEELFAPETLDS
ncbi:MAG TPA: hypothetical protein VGF84_10025, partial [Micromonosporaceae bacterium]